MNSYADYIIVQAGGKGSRLGHLTRNRPKCLVPVENRPILFHLFETFPKSRFIIIGDSHFPVLEKYLARFAQVDYLLVASSDKTGTLAGIKEALGHIPHNTPFMVIWSDLILPLNPLLPDVTDNYIVISPNLSCRWKFENGEIKEECSSSHGIAGFFLFEQKSILLKCPENGQLVKYLASLDINFSPFFMSGIREFGLRSEYDKLPKQNCRPFNKICEVEGQIIKAPITDQGRDLAVKEISWYKFAQQNSLPIPQIHSFVPLRMDKINGSSIALSYPDALNDQEQILIKIFSGLNEIHNLDEIKSDPDSYYDAWFHKTMKRLESVNNLVPFANEKRVFINGKPCRNPLFIKDIIFNLVQRYHPVSFSPIHGDPTFSNILLDKDDRIFFIDPRGYFGRTEIYGDIAYDYTKVFYSLYGNYDEFNHKNYNLFVNKDNVALYIKPNGWKIPEELFFSLCPKDISITQIHFFHALTWLSLTTYVWEDYDAICSAFYNGTKLLEDALNEYNI